MPRLEGGLDRRFEVIPSFDDDRLAIYKERGRAADSQRAPLSEVGSHALFGRWIGYGGIVCGHVEVEVDGVVTEEIGAGFLGFAPRGLCVEEAVVHLLEAALLRGGFDGDGGVGGVEVAREGEVADDVGDLSGVFLSQLFHDRVVGAACFALEVQELHDSHRVGAGVIEHMRVGAHNRGGRRIRRLRPVDEKRDQADENNSHENSGRDE